MTDILNSNITATTSFASAPVNKQDFGTPLYLAAPGSLGAGFTESVRYYEDSAGIATDLSSGDITQEAADALNIGLSQDPRPNQVALGQVPGAVSKATEVTVAGTITDGDAFEVQIDPSGGDWTANFTAGPISTESDVIEGLIASALTSVPERYLFEEGSSTDKLTVTDLLKGADTEVTVSVTGVGTITAETTIEPSGAAEAQNFEITDAGSEGDIWSLAFDGLILEYTAEATPSFSDIVDGLMALVNGINGYVAFASQVPDSAEFVLSPVYGAVTINALSLSNDGGGNSSITEVQAATPIGPLLDALLASDSDWYGLASQVKTQGMGLDLAAWTESNKRLYVDQSSDPGLLTAEVTSIGALLKGLDYGRSSSNHHPDDDEDMLYGVMCGKLAVDPDVETTTWAYARSVGSTPDLTITTTQRVALESTHTGFYNQILGLPAYWEGKTADGNFIDTLISRDWLNARMSESVTQLIVSASQRGSKIPYTDEGIQRVANVVRAVLETAIRIGHIGRILNASNVVISPTVTPPRLRDVDAADITARIIRIPYTANLQGAIHKAEISGYITTNLITGAVTV